MTRSSSFTNPCLEFASPAFFCSLFRTLISLMHVSGYPSFGFLICTAFSATFF